MDITKTVLTSAGEVLTNAPENVQTIQKIVSGEPFLRKREKEDTLDQQGMQAEEIGFQLTVESLGPIKFDTENQPPVSFDDLKLFPKLKSENSIQFMLGTINARKRSKNCALSELCEQPDLKVLPALRTQPTVRALRDSCLLPDFDIVSGLCAQLHFDPLRKFPNSGPTHTSAHPVPCTDPKPLALRKSIIQLESEAKTEPITHLAQFEPRREMENCVLPQPKPKMNSSSQIDTNAQFELCKQFNSGSEQDSGAQFNFSAQPKKITESDPWVQKESCAQQKPSAEPKFILEHKQNAQAEPDPEQELSALPKFDEEREQSAQPKPDIELELNALTPLSIELEQLEPITELTVSAMPKFSVEYEQSAQPKPDPEPELYALPKFDEEREQSAQPTPDPEPELSALPKFSEEREQSAQPKPDPEPELSALPKFSEESEQSAQPKPDPEPELSALPKFSEESEQSAQPKPDPELELSALPKFSEESEQSAQPKPDPEPELSALPKFSEESEQSAQPKPDPEPELSALPKFSEEREQSAQPKPDAEPELSALPKFSEESEQSAQPKPDPEPELSALPKLSEEREQSAQPKPDPEQELSGQPEPELSGQPDPERTLIEINVMLDHCVLGEDENKFSNSNETSSDNGITEKKTDVLGSYLKSAIIMDVPERYPKTRSINSGTVGLFRAWRATTAFINTIVAVSKYSSISPDCWLYTATFTCSCPLCVTIACSKETIYALINKITLELLEGESTHQDGMMIVKMLNWQYDPTTVDTTKWNLPTIMEFSDSSAVVIFKNMLDFAALSDTTSDIVYIRCYCSAWPEAAELTITYAVDTFAYILNTFKQENSPFEVRLLSTSPEWEQEVEWVGQYVNSYEVPSKAFYHINNLTEINNALLVEDLTLWGPDACQCKRTVVMNAAERKEELRLYFSALVRLGNTVEPSKMSFHLQQIWINDLSPDDSLPMRFAPPEAAFERCAQMLRLMQKMRAIRSSPRKHDPKDLRIFSKVAAPALMNFLRSLLDSSCVLSRDKLAKKSIADYKNVCAYTSDHVLLPKACTFTQWIYRLLPAILDIDLDSIENDKTREAVRLAQLDAYNSLVHSFQILPRLDRYAEAVSFRHTIVNNLLRQFVGAMPPAPPMPPLMEEVEMPQQILPADATLDDDHLASVTSAMEQLKARMDLLADQLAHARSVSAWLSERLTHESDLAETAAGCYVTPRAAIAPGPHQHRTSDRKSTPVVPRRRLGQVRLTSDGGLQISANKIAQMNLCQKVLKSRIFSAVVTPCSASTADEKIAESENLSSGALVPSSGSSVSSSGGTLSSSPVRLHKNEGKEMTLQQLTEKGILTQVELDSPRIASLIIMECCQFLRNISRMADEVNDGSLANPMPWNEFVSIEYLANAVEFITSYNHIMSLESQDFNEFLRILENSIIDLARFHPEVPNSDRDKVTSDTLNLLVNMHQRIVTENNRLLGIEELSEGNVFTNEEFIDLLTAMLSSKICDYVNKTNDPALTNFMMKDANRNFEMVSNAPGSKTYYKVHSSCDTLIKASFSLSHIKDILDERASQWRTIAGQIKIIPVEMLQIEVNIISNQIYEAIDNLAAMPLDQLILKEVAATQKKVVAKEEDNSQKKNFDSDAKKEKDASKEKDVNSSKKADSPDQEMDSSNSTASAKDVHPAKNKDSFEGAESETNLERPRPRLNVKNIEMLRTFLKVVQNAFLHPKKAIDSILTDITHLPDEIRRSIKKIRLTYDGAILRCSESRDLCAWLLADPLRALNSICEATKLTRKPFDLSIKVSTLSPQQHVEFCMDQLRVMSRCYLVELFSICELAQDWLIVLFELKHYEGKVYNQMQALIAEEFNRECKQAGMVAAKELKKAKSQLNNNKKDCSINALTTVPNVVVNDDNMEDTFIIATEKVPVLRGIKEEAERLIKMNHPTLSETTSTYNLLEILRYETDSINILLSYGEYVEPTVKSPEAITQLDDESLTSRKRDDKKYKTVNLESEDTKEKIVTLFKEVVATTQVINDLIIYSKQKFDFHHPLTPYDDVIKALRALNLHVEDETQPSNPNLCEMRLRSELERIGRARLSKILRRLSLILRQRTLTFRKLVRQAYLLTASMFEGELRPMTTRDKGHLQVASHRVLGPESETTSGQSKKSYSKSKKPGNKKVSGSSRKITHSTSKKNKRTKQTKGGVKSNKNVENKTLIDNVASSTSDTVVNSTSDEGASSTSDKVANSTSDKVANSTSDKGANSPSGKGAKPKASSNNPTARNEKRPLSESSDDDNPNANNGKRPSTCSVVAEKTLENHKVTTETAKIPTTDNVAVDSSAAEAQQPSKHDKATKRTVEKIPPNKDVENVKEIDAIAAKITDMALTETGPAVNHADVTANSCDFHANSNNTSVHATSCECTNDYGCSTHPTKVVRLDKPLQKVLINGGASDISSLMRRNTPKRELTAAERTTKRNMIAKQMLLQSSRESSNESTGRAGGQTGTHVEDTRDIDVLCKFIHEPIPAGKRTNAKRRDKRHRQRAKKATISQLELSLQHLRLGHLNQLIAITDEYDAIHERYEAVCAKLADARVSFAEVKPKHKVKKSRITAATQIKMDVLAACIGELMQKETILSKELEEVEKLMQEAKNKVDGVESDINGVKQLQGYGEKDSLDQIVDERNKLMDKLLEWKSSPRMTRALGELLRTSPADVEKIIKEMQMESTEAATGTVYNVRLTGEAAELTVVSTPDDPAPEPQPPVPLAEVAQALKRSAALTETMGNSGACFVPRPNTPRPLRYQSGAVLTASLIKTHKDAMAKKHASAPASPLKVAAQPASQPSEASQPSSSEPEFSQPSTSRGLPSARAVAPPPPPPLPSMLWSESSNADSEPRMRKSHKRQSDKPEKEPAPKPIKLTKKQRHLIAKEKAEEEERKRQEQENERKKALEKKKTGKQQQQTSSKGHKGKGPAGKFEVRNPNGKERPSTERSTRNLSFEPVGPPPKLTNPRDKSKRGKHDDDEPSTSSRDQPSTSRFRRDQPSTSRDSYDEPSTSRAGRDQPSTSRFRRDQPSTSIDSDDEPSTSCDRRDQYSTSRAGYDQPSTSRAGYDQPYTGRAGYDQHYTSKSYRDQPSTSRASRDLLSTSRASRDLISTHRTSRDLLSTSRARRLRDSDDQSYRAPRPVLSFQTKGKRPNEANKPEVTIMPSTPEVRDNQLQITSITPMRPGSIKPKREFEPKVTEGRCSLMEQLSSGVKVADLKLPPGITLTRVPASHVQAQQQSKDALKSVPVWDQLPVAPTPLPQPQPVINADPSMMIIAPALPEPIIAELPPLPLPVPPQMPRAAPTAVPRTGKKKKKKRPGNKNSRLHENCNGHSVNLFGPVYASSAGVNNNETLKLLLNTDIPASLHPIPGGMVNIKIPAVTHLDEEGLAKIRELADKATGTINAEPPRPAPIIGSHTKLDTSYAGATKREDATLFPKPIAYPMPASKAAANPAPANPAPIPITTPARQPTATLCPIIISPKTKSISDIPMAASLSLFSTPEELAANQSKIAFYEEAKPFQDALMTLIENFDENFNDHVTGDHDDTYTLQSGKMTCQQDISFKSQNKGNIGHQDRDSRLEDNKPFPIEQLDYAAQHPIGPIVRHCGNVHVQNNANVGQQDLDTGLEDSEPFPMTEEVDAIVWSYDAKNPIGPTVPRSGNDQFQTNATIDFQNGNTGLDDSERSPITEQLDAAKQSNATYLPQNHVMTGCRGDTSLLQSDRSTAPNGGAYHLQNDEMAGRHDGAFQSPNNNLTAPNYGKDIPQNDETRRCQVPLCLSNGRPKDFWTLPSSKKIRDLISTISPLLEPMNHLSLTPNSPDYRSANPANVTAPNSDTSRLVNRPNDRGSGISYHIIDVHGDEESNNLAPSTDYEVEEKDRKTENITDEVDSPPEPTKHADAMSGQ